MAVAPNLLIDATSPTLTLLPVSESSASCCCHRAANALALALVDDRLHQPAPGLLPEVHDSLYAAAGGSEAGGDE